jgi:hypothetical protein
MTTTFSGKNAYQHLKIIADEIGPRHGGSDNEAKAAGYIRDYFKKIGLKAKIVKYPIYSFKDATASLKTPAGKEIPCIATPITASTSNRGVTRETIFLENSDAVALDERVHDKIVVMFNTFTGDLQRKFHDYKPAGLVSIQTSPRQKHVRAPYKSAAKRKIGSVPTVKLTLEDGLKLIKKLPKKLTLKVITEGECVTKGCNVIAELKGRSKSDDETVVICAHFDSVWAGAGAVDNGGGIANIMELARVYAENGSERNLRFIAFGGEEMGLWGAYSYIKKLYDEDKKLKENKEFVRDGIRTELDKIRFLVNLDMMGQLYGKSVAVTLGHPDIAAAARLLANEMRYSLQVNENKIYSSDNMAFNYAKIPSISWHRCGFEGFDGHTSGDTIKNCSAEGLAHIGEFVEKWINRYMMSAIFPFTKILPEPANKAVEDWFKGTNPLDYEVFGPQKKYKQPRKNK